MCFILTLDTESLKRKQINVWAGTNGKTVLTVFLLMSETLKLS